jgi:hypothetical protein
VRFSVGEFKNTKKHFLGEVHVKNFLLFTKKTEAEKAFFPAMSFLRFYRVFLPFLVSPHEQLRNKNTTHHTTTFSCFKTSTTNNKNSQKKAAGQVRRPLPPSPSAPLGPPRWAADEAICSPTPRPGGTGIVHRAPLGRDFCACAASLSLGSRKPPTVDLVPQVVIADVSASRARLVLLSELDAAGHTDALEIPLLLSSDVVAADVELDQRPIVGRNVR